MLPRVNYKNLIPQPHADDHLALRPRPAAGQVVEIELVHLRVTSRQEGTGVAATIWARVNYIRQ